MSPFDLVAIFLLIVGLVASANARFLKWPSASLMLVAGLAAAAFLQLLSAGAPQSLAARLAATIRAVDFPQTVVGDMLAFLLFGGAMQVDLGELRRRRWSVLTLASVGVVVSTTVVGLGLWAAAKALHIALGLGPSLVFGALISPTDPIAVLPAVRRGRLSRRLQAVLQGEALFNDGVGLVIFAAVVALAFNAGAPAPLKALGRVAFEAVGGGALGYLCAKVCLTVQRYVDDYPAEICLTLALAMGVYSLGSVLKISGPIGVVVAGLVVGEEAASSMSAETHRLLRGFWGLVEELLNALLFLLLGLQLLVVGVHLREAWLWGLAFLLVVLARYLVVAPWGAFFRFREGERGAGLLLTWGGLHGALSLALVLSLPHVASKPILLSLTFAVVVASVLVQGLSFGRLSSALSGGRPRSPREPSV